MASPRPVAWALPRLDHGKNLRICLYKTIPNFAILLNQFSCMLTFNSYTVFNFKYINQMLQDFSNRLVKIKPSKT